MAEVNQESYTHLNVKHPPCTYTLKILVPSCYHHASPLPAWMETVSQNNPSSLKWIVRYLLSQKYLQQGNWPTLHSGPCPASVLESHWICYQNSTHVHSSAMTQRLPFLPPFLSAPPGSPAPSNPKLSGKMTMGRHLRLWTSSYPLIKTSEAPG